MRECSCFFGREHLTQTDSTFFASHPITHSILKALRFAEQQTNERGLPKARLGFIANELEASMGRMSLNSTGTFSRSLSRSRQLADRVLLRTDEDLGDGSEEMAKWMVESVVREVVA